MEDPRGVIGRRGGPDVDEDLVLVSAAQYVAGDALLRSPARFFRPTAVE
jgi:hypothetical protein